MAGLSRVAWSSTVPPDMKPAQKESPVDKQPRNGRKSTADHEMSRRPWDEYQMGYPRFAAFIAEDKDKSSTIYRRFERLAARNLLYLESELAELEKKQDALDEEYQREPLEETKSSRSWRALRDEAPETFYSMDGGPEFAEVLEEGDSDFESGIGSPAGVSKKLGSTEGWPKDNRKKGLVGGKRPDNPNSRKRLLIALRVRNVLREYYEFMKLQSDILALSKPDRRSWKATRKVFKNYNPRTRTYHSEMLGGEMMSHLDIENKHDLCVLAPPIERDRLTRLLEGRLAWIFRKRTKQGSTYYVPEQRVKIFVTLFSIVAAAAFLIGAIIGLYLVTESSTQLFMLGGFTIGFAGALGLLTNARRQDVFAATAAYAAVLVVFVSGSLSGNSSSVNSTNSSTSVVSIVTTMTSTTISTLQTTSIFQTTSIMTSTKTTVVTTIPFSIVSGSSATATSSSDSPSGLSNSEKIGIGVGVSIAGLGSILISLGVFLFYRRRNLQRRAVRASVNNPSFSGDNPDWNRDVLPEVVDPIVERRIHELT